MLSFRRIVSVPTCFSQLRSISQPVIVRWKQKRPPMSTQQRERIKESYADHQRQLTFLKMKEKKTTSKPVEIPNIIDESVKRLHNKSFTLSSLFYRPYDFLFAKVRLWRLKRQLPGFDLVKFACEMERNYLKLLKANLRDIGHITALKEIVSPSMLAGFQKNGKPYGDKLSAKLCSAGKPKVVRGASFFFDQAKKDAWSQIVVEVKLRESTEDSSIVTPIRKEYLIITSNIQKNGPWLISFTMDCNGEISPPTQVDTIRQIEEEKLQKYKANRNNKL